MTDSDSGLTIGTVIPTYNRRDALPRALGPLLEDATLDEIVIVVDGSSDGSFEYLQQVAAEDPRLHPEFIPNSGAVTALLTGVERASTDIVVTLDDDEIVAPGLFDGHLRHHRDGEEGLVAVGYVRMPPRPWRPGGFIWEFYRDAYEERCKLWEREPSTILELPYLGNASFRRSDLMRIKTQDPPRIKGYHWDWDLGLRCIKMGYRGVFDRTLVVEHEYARSFDQFIGDARSSGRGSVLMERLHPDLLERGWPGRFDTGRLPVRLLLRACGSSMLVSSAAAHALVGLIRLAAVIRSRRLEFRAARLLKKIEQQRGAKEFEREQAAAA